MRHLTSMTIRRITAVPDGWTAAARGNFGGGKSGLHGNAVPANGRRGRPQGQCHRKQTASARTPVPRRQGRNGAARAHRAPGNRGGRANPTGSKTE